MLLAVLIVCSLFVVVGGVFWGFLFIFSACAGDGGGLYHLYGRSTSPLTFGTMTSVSKLTITLQLK